VSHNATKKPKIKEIINMADINSINLTGRICRDLELKQTQNGISVCSFSLAVARPKVKDTTDFLNIVAWRHNAEFLCKYAKKGSRIGVSGVITSRKFQDQNGKNHVTFEIVADDVVLLDGGRSANDTQQGTAPAFSEPSAPQFEELSDDNLPF
jgi:single-strand DNA-binding protein